MVANALTFVCEARTRVSENEAFLKPVRTQNGLIATGSEEGLGFLVVPAGYNAFAGRGIPL